MINIISYKYEKNINIQDFSLPQCLIQCQKDVCEKLQLSLERIELSMGMSNDFEHAVGTCKSILE